MGLVAAAGSDFGSSGARNDSSCSFAAAAANLNSSFAKPLAAAWTMKSLGIDQLH